MEGQVGCRTPAVAANFEGDNWYSTIAVFAGQSLEDAVMHPWYSLATVLACTEWMGEGEDPLADSSYCLWRSLPSPAVAEPEASAIAFPALVGSDRAVERVVQLAFEWLSPRGDVNCECAVVFEVQYRRRFYGGKTLRILTAVADSRDARAAVAADLAGDYCVTVAMVYGRAKRQILEQLGDHCPVMQESTCGGVSAVAFDTAGPDFCQVDKIKTWQKQRGDLQLPAVWLRKLDERLGRSEEASRRRQQFGRR